MSRKVLIVDDSGLARRRARAILESGGFQVIEGWELDEFGQKKVKENIDELESEKAAVADLIGG